MMISLHFTSSILLLGITLSLALLQAKPSSTYIRPDETKEIFKLEKIPLTVHSMKILSKQLVILASREQENTPAQQRASAQLLALAMRIDPTSQEARTTDQLLSQGHPPQTSEVPELTKAKSKLRFYTRWLASPEAGSNANRLANYLTDASKILAEPDAQTEDTADWTGILPPLQKYPKKSQAPPSDSTNKTDSLTPPEKATPEKTPDSDAKHPTNTSRFLITELSIKSTLNTLNKVKLRYDPKRRKDIFHTVSTPNLTPVELQIKLPKPSRPTKATSNAPAKPPVFKLTFTPPIPVQKPDQKLEPPKPSTAQQITTTLTNLIKARHNQLPSGNAQIKIIKGTYALSNDAGITGPVALMLESSLTNQPLRSDTVLCAAINSQGTLLQPKNFWEMVNILRKGETGGKLIIPSGSAELITQILVFGEPDFFTRWEVFTAKDLDQAMDIAAQETHEHITQASELFASIQKLTKTTAVTKLAVNRAVRKRLGDIRHLYPSHLSSAALLLQGSGKRPIRLSEEALAHELLPVANIIHQQLYSGIEDRIPTSEALKKTHSKLRLRIDVLERLTDRSNDDLYQNTLKLTNEFRRLITISRRMTTNPEDNHKSNKALATIVLSMQDECDSLMKQIDQAITRQNPEQQ